jgi:hypothetical protein
VGHYGGTETETSETCENTTKIAGEPVSRILFALKPSHQRVTIIPLGSGSLRNSSSLPEGRRLASHATRNFRAGPALPSYLALLHAGFAVPRMLPFGRWALTPPFHPYQVRSTVTGGPSVSRRPAAEVRSSPAVCFSVALSVAAPSLRTFARLDAQPPGVTRRVALHCVVSRPRSFVPRSCEPERFGVRTFLPPLPFRKAAGDHPAHPLRGLYAKSHAGLSTTPPLPCNSSSGVRRASAVVSTCGGQKRNKTNAKTPHAAYAIQW